MPRPRSQTSERQRAPIFFNFPAKDAKGMKGGLQKDDENSNDHTKCQNNSDNHRQKHLMGRDMKKDNNTANITSLIMNP